MIVIQIYDPYIKQVVLEVNEKGIYGALGIDYELQGKSGCQVLADLLGDFVRYAVMGNRVIMFDTPEVVDKSVIKTLERQEIREALKHIHDKHQHTK